MQKSHTLQTLYDDMGDDRPNASKMMIQQTPLIMSRRFTRRFTRAITHQLSESTLNESSQPESRRESIVIIPEEETEVIEQEPTHVKLPSISSQLPSRRPSEQVRKQSTHSVTSSISKHISKQSLNKQIPEINEIEEEVVQIVPSTPPDVVKYQPFQLQPKSSFHPSLLKKTCRNKRIIARYKAYDVPDEKILNKVEDCLSRAKKILDKNATDRQEYLDVIKERLKKKNGEVGNVFGSLGSLKAKERMQERKRNIQDLREMELQYLVEGQSTSIAAIRLKEFLLVKPARNERLTEYTVRDRLRVENILN